MNPRAPVVVTGAQDQSFFSGLAGALVDVDSVEGVEAAVSAGLLSLEPALGVRV